MKNKTLAAWLALLGGPVGLHRFYLHGMRDWIGWLLPVPTALGIAGILRARAFGLDDHWSWVLIPFLGFTVAACALSAIVHGLSSPEKWSARFGGAHVLANEPAQTSWLTVFAVVAALVVGATALMATLAFTFQRYFEWQIEQRHDAPS